MKLIDKEKFKVLIADEGYMIKDKSDNGEVLDDGTIIEPYKTKIIYVGKQITTIEQCKELYEEVGE